MWLNSSLHYFISRALKYFIHLFTSTRYTSFVRLHLSCLDALVFDIYHMRAGLCETSGTTTCLVDVIKKFPLSNVGVHNLPAQSYIYICYTCYYNGE